MSNVLNSVAEVLEKTADYIERVESQQIAVREEAQMKVASAMAERLGEAIGEEVEPEVVRKLASLDSDITSLLDRVSGAGAVESMGGPSDSETDNVKTAFAGLPPEDQRFLDWCMNS